MSPTLEKLETRRSTWGIKSEIQVEHKIKRIVGLGIQEIKLELGQVSKGLRANLESMN